MKRPRGRPRKTPEPKQEPAQEPKQEPKRKPKLRLRVVEPEEDLDEEGEDPDPHHMPDPVHLLAQMLMQGEAEARRRKAERYKNMLGL